MVGIFYPMLARDTVVISNLVYPRLGNKTTMSDSIGMDEFSNKRKRFLELKCETLTILPFPDKIDHSKCLILIIRVFVPILTNKIESLSKLSPLFGHFLPGQVMACYQDLQQKTGSNYMAFINKQQRGMWKV